MTAQLIHAESSANRLEIACGVGVYTELPLPPGIWIIRASYNNGDGSSLALIGSPRGVQPARTDSEFACWLEWDSPNGASYAIAEVTITHTIWATPGGAADTALVVCERYESQNLIAAASGDGRRLDPYTGPLR